MKRGCLPVRSLASLAALLMLLATTCHAASTTFKPFSEGVTEAEADSLCAGRGDGVYALPESPNCSIYLTCCKGMGFQRECKDWRHPFVNYTPDKGIGVFDMRSGACLSNEEAGSSTDLCRVAAPGEPPAPSYYNPSAHVEEFCAQAVVTRMDLETVMMQRDESDSGHGVSMQMSLRAPTADDARIGRYAFIVNPDLGRPTTGVHSVHTVVIPGTTKVLLLSRVKAQGGAQCPHNFPDEPLMEMQMSGIFDYATGRYQRAQTLEAPFCAAHSYLANGTLFVSTGNEPGNNVFDLCKADGDIVREGRNAIRIMHPEQLALVTLAPKTVDFRWYPTHISLPDDRVIIGFGLESERGPNLASVEVFDARVNKIVKYYPELPFNAAGGWPSYPIMRLLPWPSDDPNKPEKMFFYVFGCLLGHIYSIDGDNNIVHRPDLTPPWFPETDFCAGGSASAPSVPLPFKPPYDKHVHEEVMFGGQGNRDGCRCSVPALRHASRRKLSVDTVTQPWELEEMPHPRVGADAVLLPNGKILVLNGAKKGYITGAIHGGGQASDSAYCAWLYDPDAPAGARFTVLACSTVKRLYHCGAVMMEDGDVLVVGGEQEECVEGCFTWVPPNPQTIPERFTTPMALRPGRPTITSPHRATAQLGTTLTLTYTGTVTGASLVYPMAVTHQVDMNQRHIFLDVDFPAPNTVRVRLPPASDRVAPPGMVMLFLLNAEEDTWSTKAAWITLTLDPPPAPPAPRPTLYLGCFKDTTASDTWLELLGDSPLMTVDMCAALAASRPSYDANPHFLLKGTACWGQNSLSVTMSGGGSWECSARCPGNTDQECGGPEAVTVYSLRPATPPPSVLLGCFLNPPQQRRLPWQVWSSPAMDAGLCRDVAAVHGHNLYGVQGTQCWAGNDLGEAVAGGEVLGTDCTQEDAYQLHAFTINAEYEGCLKDDLHDRVLPVRLSAWYEADLTASMCAVRAAAAGYNMYGLEFGGQCFAGNDPARLEGREQGVCDRPCAGGGSHCGGYWSVSVHRIHPAPKVLPNPLGCLATGPDRLPVLLAEGGTFGVMTPERCTKLAWMRGHSYGGIVNGRECRAGEDLKAAVGGPYINTCTSPCPGGNDGACGGPAAVSVFAVPSLPAIRPVGCYWDDSSSYPSRLLPVLLGRDNAMSIHRCARLAQKASLPLFGVEYGIECWGGTDMQRATSYGPSPNCYMQCTGDARQSCGGPDTYYLYAF